MQRKLLVLRFCLYGVISLFLVGCSSQHPSMQGYIEGDYTYVSAYIPGQLQKLAVQRGDQVKKGQLLYRLMPQPSLSELEAAQAAVAKAMATVKDLQQGERPQELAVVIAQLQQAKAQLAYAKLSFQRSQKLVKSASQAQQELDLARQNLRVAKAKVSQLKAQLVVAKLPARAQQVVAAQAAVQAAIAQLNKAKWQYQQRLVTAPISGQVVNIFYWPGEQVPAMQPVVELLPPSHIKVLFFVPEPQLKQLKIGQTVAVDCASCHKTALATIKVISPTAEYTPPLIYSRHSETKLVYRVTAYFQKNPTAWHPGQPVDVQLVTRHDG